MIDSIIIVLLVTATCDLIGESIQIKRRKVCLRILTSRIDHLFLRSYRSDRASKGERRRPPSFLLTAIFAKRPTERSSRIRRGIPPQYRKRQDILALSGSKYVEISLFQSFSSPSRARKRREIRSVVGCETTKLTNSACEMSSR